MKTLDRYLLHSFLVNYFISLFVLISLYVVLDLFVNLDEFTESGKSVLAVVAGIGDYYLYNLPLYFSQLSGVITSFAACATLARLQRLNEITAVLSSGTSMYRLAAPVMVAGLVMNGLLVFDHEVILPNVAPKLVRQRDDVEGARVYEIWFVKVVNDDESWLISAQQFSPKQQAIRNLIMMELSKETKYACAKSCVRPLPNPDKCPICGMEMVKVNTVRLGDVITAHKAQWNPHRKGWALEGGIRFSVTDNTKTGLFGQHFMDRKGVEFYPCTLTPEELRLRQTTQWLGFLSTRQLNLLAKRGDINPDRIAQVKHARFTMPISNMILLLLGMSFFMQRLPESVLTQGAKALAVCAVSFLVTFAGQQLVGAAGLSPALPAWVPVFLFGPLAVLLLDNVKT